MLCACVLAEVFGWKAGLGFLATIAAAAAAGDVQAAAPLSVGMTRVVNKVLEMTSYIKRTGKTYYSG